MTDFPIFYDDLTAKQAALDAQNALGRRKINDSFVEDDGAGGTRPISNPDGTRGQLVFTDDIPATPVNHPGNPMILSSPVNVANSTVPQSLSDLAVELSPNTNYKFDFRITQYDSPVAINISFVAPGDDPADVAKDATMQWNAGPVNGVQLGVDDELQQLEVGTALEGQLITGTITTKSSGGQFIPQFRQSVADATQTQVIHAYLEVKQSGN